MLRRRSLAARVQTTKQKSQSRSRGYMLITLALAMALIAIALLTVLPEVGQRIKRGREDELRHRGTAYMRAIQHFYKKFGRYPTRPEELENTNNIRFIRKLYKDPVNRDPATGKERDFRFLHMQDVNLSNGVLGQTPGQGLLPGQGGAAGMQGALGAMAAQAGGMQQLQQLAGGMQQPGGPGGQTATDDGSGKASSGDPNSSGSQPSSSGLSGPTFGGGPIIGVASASTSKEKTIHVFFDKDHYKDWLFIYVQGQERGGLLIGPVQPGMPTGGNLNGMVPGMGGMPGMPGQAPGLGQGPGQGLGQAPGQGFGGGIGGQSPTPPTPPQQNQSPDQ
jgi:type II secretory pathway pseudopilin PulG